MFNYSKKDLGKSTASYIVTIDWNDTQSRYGDAFLELSKELAVEGFRKGKVPTKIAEKHIKKEAVYEAVIRLIVPEVYKYVAESENLKPAIQPRIKLNRVKENEAWEIEIEVAAIPTVIVPDIKKIVAEVKGQEKKADIWVPGKGEPEKKEGKDLEEAKMKLLNTILEALLSKTEITIADLIVEEEVNKRLTQLYDDIKKLGMTVDQYFLTKKTTIEKVKKDFQKEIVDMYALELALEKIANDAHITVEEADLEAVFKNITDEKARGEAQKNAYVYASFLKRQKTLDYLISL